MLNTAVQLGLRIITAYFKYKQNKKNIEFFRELIKICNEKVDKFVELTLDEFIKNLLSTYEDEDKLEEKEAKIRKKIINFCVSIPNILKDMGYADVYPELIKKKKRLFQKLQEYENLEILKLKERFNQNITQFNEEFKDEFGMDVSEIQNKIGSWLEKINYEEEFPTAVATTQIPIEFQHKFFKMTNDFISKYDLNVPPKSEYRNYLETGITGTVMNRHLPEEERDMDYFSWDV